MPQTAEERKEYHKKWYEKNKQKKNEDDKKWYEKNKQKKNEDDKKWYEKNKQRIKKVNKEYNETEKGKKSYRIKNWKHIGIISEDFDTIYDIYINTTNCDYCNVELTEGKGMNSRNLDHDHETGEVRGILCNRCNLKDVFKKLIIS